ncbi:MAG: hypothetical protein JXA30_02225 [Deltaproteobacteria bacterium]|nr:hypothetical protein [Deltaproteobacteria bacterium]
MKSLRYARDGIIVVDVKDPAAPKVQSLFPLSPFNPDSHGNRAFVEGSTVWVLSQGSLSRYEIEF